MSLGLEHIIPDVGTNNDYDTGLSSARKINDNSDKIESEFSIVSEDIEELNSNKVSKTGNETIAGIKTFTSSPTVPNATENGQAANLLNVKNKVQEVQGDTTKTIAQLSEEIDENTSDIIDLQNRVLPQLTKAFALFQVDDDLAGVHEVELSKSLTTNDEHIPASTAGLYALEQYKAGKDKNEIIDGEWGFTNPLVIADAELDVHAVTLYQLNAINKEQCKVNLSAIDANIDPAKIIPDPILSPFDLYKANMRTTVSTAPVDLEIIVDIKKNGTSILGNKIKILAGQTVDDGSFTLLNSPTSFAKGDIRTFEILQVGMGETGKNLIYSEIQNKK